MEKQERKALLPLQGILQVAASAVSLHIRNKLMLLLPNHHTTGMLHGCVVAGAYICSRQGASAACSALRALNLTQQAAGNRVHIAACLE
jgi:hypothetical protein